MARLPRVNKLTTEQLASFKPEERLEKLLPTINGLIDGSGFLNKQLTLGDNLAAKVFTVNVDMPSTDPHDWLTVGGTGAPAFSGTFANYNVAWTSASFKKNADGMVLVRGLVTAGGHGTVFTLPVGYRPAKNAGPFAQMSSGPALGYLEILSTGAVNTVSGGLVFFNIDTQFEASDTSTEIPACFPSYQKWDLPSPPTLCWIGAIRDREDNSQLVLNPTSLQWEYVVKDGAGAIKINNVTGLQYGRKYAITMVGLVG